MNDDTILPFWFPAIGGKKITAAFDGGRISSDSGVMLLAQAERKLALADKLAAAIADRERFPTSSRPLCCAFTNRLRRPTRTARAARSRCT
jgi:hypothetical protein